MRLIDESKVMNEIERFKGYLDDDMIMRIKIAINKLPTIDAELVKHGKWLMSDVYGAYCSECGSAAFEITGSQYSKMKTRYCWHCGARMDAE